MTEMSAQVADGIINITSTSGADSYLEGGNIRPTTFSNSASMSQSPQKSIPVSTITTNQQKTRLKLQTEILPVRRAAERELLMGP